MTTLNDRTNRELALNIRRGDAVIADRSVMRSLARVDLSSVRSELTSGRGPHWPAVDTRSARLAVEQFHEQAGTLTPLIRKNVGAVFGGVVPIARVAHTPDFYPYQGVVSGLALLNSIATAELGAVPVFLVVDCDTSQDSRIRRAALSPTDPAVFLEVPRAKRSRALAFSPTPSAEQLDSLRSRLAKFARQHRVLPDWQIQGDLDYAIDNSSSLGSLLTILLSRIVNLRLGMPIVFVRHSDIGAAFKNAYRQVASEATEMTKEHLPEAASILRTLGFHVDTSAFKSPGMWLVCTNCGRRHLDPNKASEQCAGTLVEIPRLAVDGLSDWLVWGFGVGVTYPGSVTQALLLGRLHDLTTKSGWRDVVWAGAVADRHLDAFSKHQGRSSILNGIASFGPVEWLDRWERSFTSGIT